MKTQMIAGCVVCMLIAVFCGTARAADTGSDAAAPVDRGAYPLGTCAVTGEPLGSMGDAITETINGREVKFCCAGCVGKYKANPAEYDKKLDAAIVEQQTPHYPLDTCLVLGGKLDSMGGPLDYVYKNRLVRLCCKGCVGKLEKEPEKFLAALDKAVIEKQKADYPVDYCLVSKEKLGEHGGAPVDLVVASRLVRLCCAACAKEALRDPNKFIKLLDEAKAGKVKK